MQGGEIQGVANLIGLFLVKAGGALINNMTILFAIGVGVGMSEKNDGTGAIAALYPLAQQVLGERITADMQAHNSCCAAEDIGISGLYR